MQTLVLLRHAAAALDMSAGDRDRPLTEMGRQQAQHQGAWLAERVQFDRVLCSPAVRTQETAAAAGIAVSHVIETIYEAPVSTLALLVESHCDAVNLLLIGHNPGISGLAGFLTGQRLAMAPGSIVGIRFDQPGPPQPGSGVVRLYRPPPTVAG